MALAFLTQDLESGDWFVIKNISAQFELQKLLVDNEIKILHERKLLQASVINEDSSQIVMKLGQGVTLDKFVDRFDCAYSRLKRIISMLAAVDELHDQKILHGDLKFDNMLCNINNDVTLIDNGLSKKMVHNTNYAESQFVNNLYSKAPGKIPQKIDIPLEIYVLGYFTSRLLGVDYSDRSYRGYFIDDISDIAIDLPDETKALIMEHINAMLDDNPLKDLPSKTVLNFLN